MSRYETLDFTTEFMETFSRKDFGPRERNAILKALELLDANERHPSLRVHGLDGELANQLSFPASDSLRITFERLAGGRKLLLKCSRHYDK